MKFRGQILSEEEQIRVYHESLRILAEVGVKFYSDKALPILKANGAVIDWNSKIAKIPQDLVTQALQTARSHEFYMPSLRDDILAAADRELAEKVV